MINTENNYIWLDDSCIKSIEIYIDGVQYQYAQGSLKLSESINSSECVDFSCTDGSTFSLSIIDYNNEIGNLNNKPLEVYVTGTLDGATSRIKVGTYTILETTRDNERIVNVVGYDNMQKFDVDVSEWYNNLTPNMNLRAILISLCEYLNVDYIVEPTFINSDYVLSEIPNKVNGVTGRDVLSSINNLSCSYWKPNRQGSIERYDLGNKALLPADDLFPSDDLFPFDGIDFKADLSKVANIKVAEYLNPTIDKVVLRESEDAVGVIVGVGKNAYYIQGNILVNYKDDASLRTLVENIYNEMQTIRFNPTIVNLKYLPFLECGDKVRVDLGKGGTTEFFIFQRDVSNFPYGLEEINCMVEPTTDTYEPVNKSIEKMSGKMHTITNTIEELSSEIFDEDTGLVSRISQTEKQIELKVGTDNVISAINLSTEGININGSKINISGNTTFNSLQSDFDSVTTYKGGQTYIDGGKITTEDINVIGSSSDVQIKLNNGYVTISSGGRTSTQMSDNDVTANIVVANNYMMTDDLSSLSNNAQIAFNNGIIELNSGNYILVNHTLAPSDVANLGFNDSGSAWRYVYSLNAFQNISDIREKNSIDYDVDVSWLKDLKICEFEYNVTPNEKHLGCIAQETINNKGAKYFLRGSEEEHYTIGYEQITIANVKYTQMLEKRVEELENKLNQLLKKGVD